MTLRGLTVLVLEDEPIIAMALEDHLEDAGAVPLLAGTLAEASRIVEAQSLDAAILDINVHGETSYPIAAMLEARGVRFIFASGYGGAVHEGDFVGCPTVTKPYDLSAIEQALTEARSASA